MWGGDLLGIIHESFLTPRAKNPQGNDLRTKEHGDKGLPKIPDQ